MIDFVKNKIDGKRLLILGFGREGESTYRFLRKHFPDILITVADKNPEISGKIKDLNTELIVGEQYLDSLDDFDIIFKTPGISLNFLPVKVDPKKITSQTDIFLDYFSSQIIGITGTKGKSTTSSLIFHIIKLFTTNAVLVGNIGVPPFDHLDEITENTKIIYELSSHQLEYITKGPHIGILLNLFQEHLDHYETFETYQQSKFNITRYQEISDSFIFNADDILIRKLVSDANLERNYIGCSLQNIQSKGCWMDHEKLYFSDGTGEPIIIDLSTGRLLKGDHNVRNIMAAVCACKLTGVPDDVISEGIRAFKGLEHRMEYVGEFNGIHFYNDSIATIPEATIEAVKTLKNVDTLILGGFDRGIEYNKLVEFIAGSAIRNILLLGEAGKRIQDGLKQYNTSGKIILHIQSLEDAVRIAKEKTAKSKICLLSPAAASYDKFKNFEERGSLYKKLVRDI
ncbi:MAG: UDP-N-acetylmuramoyl-L-alanine--D-glutamate ligase [Bacteroidales bacterium]